MSTCMVTEFNMAASSSSSSSGSDWEEEEDAASVPCQCLFCSAIIDGGAQLMLDHCCQHHSFDLKEYVRKMRECD